LLEDAAASPTAPTLLIGWQCKVLFSHPFFFFVSRAWMLLKGSFEQWRYLGYPVPKTRNILAPPPKKTTEFEVKSR